MPFTRTSSYQKKASLTSISSSKIKAPGCRVFCPTFATTVKEDTTLCDLNFAETINTTDVECQKGQVPISETVHTCTFYLWARYIPHVMKNAEKYFLNNVFSNTCNSVIGCCSPLTTSSRTVNKKRDSHNSHNDNHTCLDYENHTGSKLKPVSNQRWQKRQLHFRRDSWGLGDTLRLKWHWRVVSIS